MGLCTNSLVVRVITRSEERYFATWALDGMVLASQRLPIPYRAQLLALRKLERGHLTFASHDRSLKHPDYIEDALDVAWRRKRDR